MAKFKQSVLEKMKGDIDLFSALSKALNIKPVSLPVTIDRNGNTINQYSIVKLVADHLKVEPEELLEEDTVNESEGNK
jgi:hypothetical protein